MLVCQCLPLLNVVLALVTSSLFYGSSAAFLGTVHSSSRWDSSSNGKYFMVMYFPRLRTLLTSCYLAQLQIIIGLNIDQLHNPSMGALLWLQIILVYSSPSVVVISRSVSCYVLIMGPVFLVLITPLLLPELAKIQCPAWSQVIIHQKLMSIDVVYVQLAARQWELHAILMGIGF